MEIEIKKIDRAELCVLQLEEINYPRVAWALSKGLKTIYIERQKKLVGSMNLLDYIESNNGKININTHLYCIKEEDYIKESQLGKIFSRAKAMYVPIVRDKHIVGELQKV